jgi:hypothetical protein
MKLADDLILGIHGNLLMAKGWGYLGVARAFLPVHLQLF